jgi:hypothetical protein
MVRRSESNSALTKNNRRSPRHSIMERGVLLALALVCLCGWLRATEKKEERPRAPERTSSSNPSASDNDANCRIIYLGFVGALEPGTNKYSGVVQIRKTLQGKEFTDICAKSLSPYVWTEGRDWLMKHFPSHEGVLTPAELEHAPKVILVGHSMGGWAMMSVARDLRDHDIPVELTIQMDSVGITDITIPRNVKSAAIFHARDMLMFMTTKHVRREDPSYTQIVADVMVDGAGHQSITRDPRIRALVMKTIQSLRIVLAEKSAPMVPYAAAKDTHSTEPR